jgi:hypothetical protein
MPKFRVDVACDVPAYARVDVEADSEAHAIQRAKRDIAENGFSAVTLDSADFTTDWENAENPRVVDGA